MARQPRLLEARTSLAARGKAPRPLRALLLATVLLLLAAPRAGAQASPKPASPKPASAKPAAPKPSGGQGAAAGAATSQAELNDIATDGYLYLLPLVVMDLTKQSAINAPEGSKVGAGPQNKFHNARDLLDANFKAVVRPNSDTLYSQTWLDLSKEPMVVSAPDTNGRYYLLPMLDMWTDVFAVPGARTSGTKAGAWAVVPPGWSGQLPKGVGRIDAPTKSVWIIGRTQVNGPNDLAAVRKIQDGYKITPLSAWGKPGAPPPTPTPPPKGQVDLKTPPKEQLLSMSPEKFWSYAAELLKENPPHITDWSILERLKRLGIEPGKSFDFAKAPPAVKAALQQAQASAVAQMKQKGPGMAQVVNGWQVNTDGIGVYGNNYVKRAIVAVEALGANPPEDAFYPLNLKDSKGQPLAAPGRYVLKFPKGQLPPVGAFWSVTLYDKDGYFVPNSLNRYLLGSRDNLKTNPDGSTDIYIQSGSPGADKEASWLPAPKEGPFSLTMRMYEPKAAALDGGWSPPPVVKIG